MLDWTRRILLGVLALVLLVPCAGVVYEQWARRQIPNEFPPPGELVGFGGARSHLDCAGEGSPTVVLEAGLGVAGSRVWTDVQPAIVSESRVCSYDRAGILWSEAREGPRSADRIARELQQLLDAASVPPPTSSRPCATTR